MNAKRFPLYVTLFLFAAPVLLAGAVCTAAPAPALAADAKNIPAPAPPAAKAQNTPTPAPAADVKNIPVPAPAAQDIVAPGAEVKKIGTGFAFVEGPAASPQGDVYFSDIHNSRIHKWSPKDNTITVYREDTGESNGLMFDKTGRLVACHHKTRNVTRDDMKGYVVVLAGDYDGKKLNSPNDLWIDPKGGVYFSDPRYGRTMDDLEQDGFHVYYISPDGKKTTRVVSDMIKPNGLIGTTDGKTLYIADADGGKIWAYQTQPDGTLWDKKLFAEGGSDGMTLDERGNVYVTRDKVVVYDAKGALIREIAFPETPANVTFAGPERKTLFVTARTSVYTLEMAVRGIPAPFER